MKVIVGLLTCCAILHFGCSATSGSSGDNTRSIYSGIEPQGDFVTVVTDGAQISIQNFTQPAASLGPVHFSPMTDPAVTRGFHNLYTTDAIDSSGQYVMFAMEAGVIVVYQKLASSGEALGAPGYAFYGKTFELGDLKPSSTTVPKAFNSIRFINSESYQSCAFGNLWFTDNGDGTGTMSGAEYDANDASLHQYGLDADGLPYGVGNPFTSPGTNPSAPVDWAAMIGMFDPATGTLINYDGEGYKETIAATESGMIVNDRGPNRGGGFWIPQADSPDFKAVYAGTYLLFGFEPDPSSSSYNMKTYRATLANTESGRGKLSINDFSGESDCPLLIGKDLLSFSEASADVFPGGIDLKDAFKRVSTYADNQTAYLESGSFVFGNKDSSFYLSMDPAGEYFFFMTLDTTSENLKYMYGFGLRDDSYDSSAEQCKDVALVPLEFPFSNPDDVPQMNLFAAPDWGTAGQLHQDIDLHIKNDRSGSEVISPVYGTITKIDGHLMSSGTVVVAVTIYINDEYSLRLGFEPLSSADFLQTQMNAIKVTTGQPIRPGDIIGNLLVGPESDVAFLAVTLIKDETTYLCPYAYSSADAKKIYERIATDMGGVTICNMESFIQ